LWYILLLVRCACTPYSPCARWQDIVPLSCFGFPFCGCAHSFVVVQFYRLL
jgi:hypothetical protein